MVRNIDDLEFCLPSHSDSILSGLQALRFNPQLSDVTLLVQGKELPCHRAVLALCSQYFHAMFTGNFQESIAAHVEIKEVDADLMETLINFCYTGHLTINQNNVEGLISISNQLHFPAVRKVCIRYLQQQMDATNCLGIWEFGETHGCPEVTAKAWSFLQENFEAVCQEEEFLLLPPERLLQYLGDPLLQVREDLNRAKAVLQWVRQDETTRSPYLPELLSIARLSNLTDHCLQELEAEPLISESEPCRVLIRRNLGKVTKEHRESATASLQQVLVVVGGKVLEEEEEDGDDDDEEQLRTTPNFAYYNPKTKMWMALPDFPDYNKWGFSITSLNNDVYVQLLHTLHENGGMTSVGSRIYVTGGHWHGMAREYSVVMESYDSSSDIWTREGALPSRWMYHCTSAIFMDTSRWANIFRGQSDMEV
uniref:BTB domain-containing protein n=1 Tax=Pyxicephalus adspersus TaxID=30357 RepID=A0AAV3AT33_PYXAD|nr:TPA: hypothetical protein GDO54_010273 [Pyxicephalus adspersus]